ncbi:MAG: hypothetical protein E6J30_02725 [Chloroflexi bacterium]|nr:MAG: hypothetical protein E6J30_02725 [Chloroflexota bacterium]
MRVAGGDDHPIDVAPIQRCAGRAFRVVRRELEHPRCLLREGVGHRLHCLSRSDETDRDVMRPRVPYRGADQPEERQQYEQTRGQRADHPFHGMPRHHIHLPEFIA